MSENIEKRKQYIDLEKKIILVIIKYSFHKGFVV